ncbi:MAG: CPBP family intramembrane metalloprotease, partial [Planctomycetota bacterium]
KKLERNFQKILGHLTLYQTFLLGLFSALGEELFFRGAMQYSLGLVATSIIFGFLHVMPSQEKHWYQRFSWTIFAIIMGFAFGYMMEVRGSLVGPISAHFWINFINLSFICRKKK